MKITENYFENNLYNLTLDLSPEEFEKLFVRCSSCGKIVLRDDEELLCFDGKYYCSDCTFECLECGEVLPICHSYSVCDSSSLYCRSCYENETYVCHECGGHFRYEDSLHYIESEEYDLCNDCYDDTNSVLDDYHSFKDYGNIMFLGKESRKDCPYLGFELECDAHNFVSLDNVVGSIRNLVPTDYYHYEHDGSLSYGFEMISQPCSLSYHLSLTDTHKKVFAKLIESNLRGHDIPHCGLHIHIDKSFFGDKLDSSTAKLLYIFEKFSSELIKFSRRNNYQISDWARFRKNENTSADWIKNTVKDSKGYLSHDERYHAVNLTNSQTIEIRLWRSTLNINTFTATLKFTDRLAHLVKDTPAVKLARMSFLDLIGDDTDIKSYWDKVKNRDIEEKEDF